MKNLSKKLEDIFSAITFAEAGEFDFARLIVREERAVMRNDAVAERNSPSSPLQMRGRAVRIRRD